MKKRVIEIENLLRAIKAANISLTPRNIELWSAHLEGRMPALSRDINQQYRDSGALTDKCCDTLYEKHFPYQTVETELRKSLLTLAQNANEQIYALSVLLEENLADQQEDTNRAQTERLQAMLESFGTLTETLRHQSGEISQTIRQARNDLSSLRRLKNKTTPSSSLDPVTGVLKRDSFDRGLADWSSSSAKTKRSLAIINVRLNSLWLEGMTDDAAHEQLFEAADLINDNIKGSDELCRFDETSFAIVLPMTRLAAADILGEKIRAAFSAAALIAHDKTLQGQQMCYIGVSSFQAPETPSEFAERAAECAKFAEQNDLKIVICEDSPELNDFRAFA